MSDVRRYFIAAGTQRYQDADELLSVPDDLAKIGEALAEVGYQPALELVDPGTDKLRRALGSWASSENRAADALVVYYTGHGERDGHGHFLLCADSETSGLVATALRTEDIATILTSQGVRRLLVIVDTCYAEQGGSDAVRRMAEYLSAELIPQRDAENRDPLAFAVIAAARTREPAEQSAFATAFRAALNHPGLGGPRQPNLYLEAVVDHVNQQFEQAAVLQHATCAILAHESGFGFLPNPRFAAELPPEGTDLAEQRTWLRAQARRRRDELAQHFAPRGRGTDIGAEAGHYFVGRIAVLRRLVSALSEPGRFAIVVTGSPGAGKSAVLGRLVLLSSDERRAVPPETVPPGTDPGPGAVDVAIHARHKTLPEVVAGIAAGLGLETDDVETLVAASTARTEPFVVVVDALDEAGTADDSEPERIGRELLRRLAEVPAVRLVVGTRKQVVEACGPGFALLDLDEPRWVSRDDLAVYAKSLLLAPHGPGSASPYDEETATPIAEGIAETAYPNYLVARLTARALAARDSVVPALPGWQRTLPSPGPEAARAAGPVFRWALSEQLGAGERRARELLTPLAFAEGAGLPWGRLWPAMSAAVFARPYRFDDIEWLLTASGAHVVEALDERNRSVYRLYHESFTDELRAGAPRDTQDRVVDALIASVPRHPTRAGRDWASADPYVRTHLATHAAACGRLDELVLDPEYLLAAEREPLLRALPAARSEAAVLACRAYEQVAHLLGTRLSFAEQASCLQLAAHKVGAAALASAASQVPGLPWQVRWAHIDPQRRRRRIGPHEHEVTAVAYVDLDRTPSLVTGDAQGDLHLWKLSSGERVGGMTHESFDEIRELTVLSTAEGELVVVLCANGTIAGWFPATGRLIGNPLPTLRDPESRCAAVVSDGVPLVAVIAGTRFGLWELRTGRRLIKRRAKGFTWSAGTAGFVRLRGKDVLVVSVGKIPFWFGTQTWRKNPLRVCLYAVDGKRLATFRGKNVDVHGVESIRGRPSLVTSNNPARPGWLQESPDLAEFSLGNAVYGPMYRAGYRDRAFLVIPRFDNIELWDSREGHLARVIRMRPAVEERLQPPAAFETGGTAWLAVAEGRTVLMVDIDQESDAMLGSAYATNSFAVYDTPSRVVAVGVEANFEGPLVQVCDFETGQVVDSVGSHTRLHGLMVDGGLSPIIVTAAVGSKNNTRVARFKERDPIWEDFRGRGVHWPKPHLVSADRSTIVLVYHEKVVCRKVDGGRVTEFKVPYTLASAVLVVDGEPILFTLGLDGLIAFGLTGPRKQWSVKSAFRGINPALAAGEVAGAPVVAACAEDRIVLHDARSGEPTGQTLEGPMFPVDVLEIGRLGGREVLVAVGQDHAVWIWDLRSGQRITAIEIGSAVTALKIVPDFSLMIGTEAGALRVDLDPGLFASIAAEPGQLSRPGPVPPGSPGAGSRPGRPA